MFGSATPRVVHFKEMHPESEALLVDSRPEARG